MSVFSNITEILDRNKATDIVYLDLSKAFIAVPHKALIAKLKNFSIGDNLIKWFDSYLLHRLQRVMLPDGTPDWREVTSGLPQGSILGPLLFLIYINDLPNVISDETYCAIFADDTKVYYNREIRNISDAIALQQDLMAIHQWGGGGGRGMGSGLMTPNAMLLRLKEPSLILQYNIPAQLILYTYHMKQISKLWLLKENLGYHSPYLAKWAVYLSVVRSIVELSPSVLKWPNPQFLIFQVSICIPFFISQSVNLTMDKVLIKP